MAAQVCTGGIDWDGWVLLSKKKVEMRRVKQRRQIAMELLRQGDVWKLETARNPEFSSAKWLPASMWGTSFK